MARTFPSFLIVAIFICLLKISTAFNLGAAIEYRAYEIVQTRGITCYSYESFCNSNGDAFADIKDSNNVDVSSSVCKVALSSVLGC